MPEPPLRAAPFLFSSMLIPGLDRNTCAEQLEPSGAVVPAAVRGWRLIVKFHAGAEFFFAFLLLCISDSTSAPEPFSLPLATIFLQSAASTKFILRAKKSFSLCGCNAWADSDCCVNQPRPPAGNY